MPRSPTPTQIAAQWSTQARDVVEEIRRSYWTYREPILLFGYTAKLVGMSGTELLAQAKPANCSIPGFASI